MLRSLPLFVLASGLVAQQFAPYGGRTPAEVPAGPWSVMALADCDGDGDQDAAVNDPFGNLFAVLRRGPGDTWTTTGLLPGIVTAAAWADFDGDGDLDVLVGATGTPAAAPFGMFRNDGATFTWRGQAPSVLAGTIDRFAIGDVDGDLLPDVVAGMTTGVQMVRNLGNTTFGAATVVTSQSNARPALFDRDGDGDLDLVVASATAVQLFDNVAGVFVPSGSTLPTGTAGSDVVAGDLDGDTRLDLALAHGGTVDVLWNQATGWLLAAAVVPAGDAVREVLGGDLDRDGDRDLVVRTAMAADWLQNDGNGGFTRLPALRYGAPWHLTGLALGDAAARGACDVVGAFADGQVRTLYGNAPQPFLDPQALPAWAGQSGNYPGELAVGDVDGDGRVDMVSPRDCEVLHDDGRGRFSRRPIAGARPDYHEAWLADLDGDGDLDLVLGTQSTPMPPVAPLQRFVNDGLGNFTPVQDITMFAALHGFRFGDVDGDGDVDMLCPNSGSVQWYRNTGNGTLFNNGPLLSVQTQALGNELVFADLDGDGDRDIVCGHTNSTLPVFLNDGSGTFTAVGSLPLTSGTYAWNTREADLDGDGALDIVVNESGTLVAFHNNGSAGFTRTTGAFPAGGGGGWLEFVDVDEDGDLDLETGGAPHRLLVNDGTGVFSGGNALLWSTSFGRPRFADVDEDGDVDMVALIDGAWRRVLDRTHGAESTQVVRAGGPMQVRFFVQPQAPVPGALVLPLASIGPGPSTAFAGLRGRLLLPSSLVVLGAVDASTGTAMAGFQLPPLPGLLGLDLCVQGLVIGPGLPAGFTNVVDERILP
jgi:hypothetical protein